MGWWRAPDVTGWRIDYPEPRGLRAKDWVVDEAGQRWLRKSHRDSRPFEPAIEALTLELGRRCGLDVSVGTACVWQAADGRMIPGFASKLFHDTDEESTTGGELVGANLDVPFDTTSEREAARPSVTPAVVRQVIESHGARFDVDLVTPFTKMLAFDAWIGNGDRHSGNWAIIHGPRGSRLAPMYDTAACLGAELLDRALAKRLDARDRGAAITDYANRCKSGFGDGDKLPGVYQRDLIHVVSAWPEWQVVAPPLVSFISNNLQMVNEVLSDVPDAWLPPRRKEFARALLEARVILLEEALR
jgi:hypothetical protein